MVDSLTRSRRRAACIPALAAAAAAALALPTAAPAAYPGPNGPIVYHDNRSIFTVSPGEAPHALPEDVPGFGGLSVSGNGLRIAYSDGHIVYTMNIDGSAQRRVTPEGAPNSDNPSISADGTKIAYERDHGIWVMDADGGGAHSITPDAGFQNAYSDPAWSPDGTRLAFTVKQQVGVMNADGSGRRILTPPLRMCDNMTRTMSGQAPAWTPDGARIVFTGPVLCAGRLGTDIWAMGADGSGQTDLIGDDGTDDHAPTVSPDGTKIAFRRGISDYVLETIGVGGGATTQVPQVGDRVDGPDWAVAYEPPSITATVPRKAVRAHARAAITGRVTPASSGRVRVVVKRGKKVAAKRTVRLKRSRFRLRWAAKRPGRYRVTATLLADATHVSVTSRARTLRVRR
ncbi:MAG TPA: hypothetical protein VFT50_07170 [Baekduia sp.]|nr:hypothetical protein [Baekduia sp.]